MLMPAFWNDLFVPAHRGDHAAVLTALPRHTAPDARAVAVRALWRIGHHAAASRELERLGPELSAPPPGAPGGEVLALAMLCRPAPGQLEARLSRCTTHGEAADTWSDAALLHLRHGRWRLAVAATRAALSACPDHLEARYIDQFIREDRPIAKLMPKPGAALDRLSPRSYDLTMLSLSRDLGVLSPLRLSLRLTELSLGPRPTPATGLARLVDAGVPQLFFDDPAAYAQLPAIHPAVDRELDLSRATLFAPRHDVHLRQDPLAKRPPTAADARATRLSLAS